MTISSSSFAVKESTERRIATAGELISLTKHAAVRCAQRGISRELIGIILDYGRSVYDRGGGCRWFLGSAEKKHLDRIQPDISRRFGRKLDCVVVVSSRDGEEVITTYVRNRRH